MKKFRISLMMILIVGMLLIQNVAVLASTPIKLMVNGQYIQCDVQPQIINGRTMIPVATVAQALGATVSWDEVNQTVIINQKATSTTSTPIKNNNPEKEEFLKLKAKADSIIANSYDKVMNGGYDQSIYDNCLAIKTEFMKWGNVTSDYSTIKSYYEYVLSDIGALNVDNEFLSEYPGNDKWTSERSTDKGELFRDKARLDGEISRLQKLGKL